MVAVVLSVIVLPRAEGQDLTEDRLNALETQVADLSTRVAILESGTASGSAETTAANAGGTINFEGTGGKITTDITELSGVYKISATCSDGFFFQVETTNIDNPDDFVYINLAGEIPFSGEVVYTFDPARYIFAIDCAGPWTLLLEPIS